MQVSKVIQPSTKELAKVFKALSDPNRLAILELLRYECGGSCCLEGGDEEAPPAD